MLRLVQAQRSFASGFRPQGQQDEQTNKNTFKNNKGVGSGQFTKQRTGANENDLNPIDLLSQRPVKSPRASPKLRQEIGKSMPSYMKSGQSKALDEMMDEAMDPSNPLTYKYRDPAEFMKHMDSSFESFFYQREYTEKNFAFYFQVLSSQSKPSEALKAFRRMESMKIVPTDRTYNQLIRCFARDKDLQMVEKLNDEAISKYGILPTKYRYNNLLLCYAKLNQPYNAEKVVREMIERGLQPDGVTYTTLIDAYNRAGNFKKCWELFQECRTTIPDGGDEMLVSFMIRIASKTHESELALKLFAELESDGYIQQAKPYNSIISALGSTQRYANQAIEYWHKMQLAHIVPDEHTCVAVLRACSKLGDVQTAYDCLKDIKMHGIPMTEHVYNGLIKTYAGAAAVRGVKEEHVDMYIKDAMELYEQMQKEGININSHILNSLLELHANGYRVDELDSKILPLYEKHNIKPCIYTYQRLAKLYFHLNEHEMVKSIYKDMREQGIKSNKHFLSSVIQSAIRTDDADVVYDTLKDYVDIGHEPHFRTLNTLNNMKHIPDRIYVLLHKHFGWSGQMTAPTRQFEKAQFRQKPEKNMEPIGQKGKRYKSKKAAVNKTMSYQDRRSIGKVM